MEIQLDHNYYKPFSIPYIRAYTITMRPYLMFVSGITGIAGISFGDNPGLVQIILISLAAFLSYGFGQALTDCFQTDTDSISSPYRPLTQNVVSKKAFIVSSIAGLTFCIGILYGYNHFNILLGFVAGAGLATYTYFKRRWWGGPFYNAWIVTVLFFMSLLSVSGSSMSMKVLLAASAVFFGYANFVLSGYFKDIEADRATGYNTLPVIYGKKLSSFVSDLFALAALIAVLFIISGNLPAIFNNSGTFVFFTVAVICSGYAQVRLHRVRNDNEAFKAISPVVHTYIFLLTAITLNNKPDWLIPLIIFVTSYFVVLKLRPSKAQI